MKLTFEVPEAFAVLGPAIALLLDRVARQTARTKRSPGARYGDFPKLLKAQVAELERRRHSVALAALDIDAPRTCIGGEVLDWADRPPPNLTGRISPGAADDCATRSGADEPRNSPRATRRPLRSRSRGGGLLH
jgi:hypothetical protein